VLAIQAKRYFEELFHLGTSILRATRGEPLFLPPRDVPGPWDT
jgi:hypothetical protein